jgi:hypothetical protein
MKAIWQRKQEGKKEKRKKRRKRGKPFKCRSVVLLGMEFYIQVILTN